MAKESESEVKSDLMLVIQEFNSGKIIDRKHTADGANYLQWKKIVDPCAEQREEESLV